MTKAKACDKTTFPKSGAKERAIYAYGRANL
jgi:hypothetical protein